MFCYVVGNSIKTLLAGKLHFLWRMGMGHPSRAGIWASGLAARFITSPPPASVPLNLAGHGEPKQCHRTGCVPHTLASQQPSPTWSISHRSWLSHPGPAACQHPHHLGLGLHRASQHSRGQKNLVPVMGSFPTAKDKYLTRSYIHHAGPFTHPHPSLMLSVTTFS